VKQAMGVKRKSTGGSAKAKVQKPDPSGMFSHVKVVTDWLPGWQ